MPQNIQQWLTEDPIGRLVAIGGLVIVGLIALVILFRSARWAAARWKMFVGIAIAIGIVLYLVQTIGQLGLGTIIILGLLAFGMLVAWALFMTQGGK